MGVDDCDAEFDALFGAIVELHVINCDFYQLVGFITLETGGIATGERERVEQLRAKREVAISRVNASRYAYELAARRVCREP